MQINILKLPPVHVKSFDNKARRGDIVDSKGNLLATTRSVVDVGMDPP